MSTPAPAPKASFDEFVREQLGPRPQRSDPDFAIKNREWDRRYAELFPNALLPSYLPKRPQKGLKKYAI